MLKEREKKKTYGHLSLDPARIRGVPGRLNPNWLKPNDGKVYIIPVTGNSTTPTLKGAGKGAKLE